MKPSTVSKCFLGILFLFSASFSFASDVYEGQLTLYSPNKAGVLITGSKNIEGRILITRNKKSLTQIPISVDEISFGVSAGFKFSGQSFIQYTISGLTENTKVSDLFEPYTGSSIGGTFSVPGPCCITLNKEVMNIENSKGIQISGDGQSSGWMFDISKSKIRIRPLSKYSDRKIILNKSLAEIPESEYQISHASTLLSLECIDSNENTTYFLSVNGFYEITAKTYDSNPLKSLFSKTSSPLKPTIVNNILYLYPEKINGQIIGARFDVDLNSEFLSKKDDFFGRKISYFAKKVSADSVVSLTCLSKDSLKGSLIDIGKYHSSIWK